MITAAIDWIERAGNLTLRVENLIGGSHHAVRGRRLEKYSPRDGRPLYSFGAGEVSEVETAVQSARAAFEDGRWSRAPVKQRVDALRKLASLIEAHSEEFALRESLDVGKPIYDALHFDVPGAAAVIRFNAEAADKVHGKVYAASDANLSFELQRPLGVVAGIVGWNFPLYLAAQKVGPVLATGNSLILKPSEMTSLSACRLGELALEAGIPEGVLNVVHGDARIGAELARHADIDALTFTGSSRTGKQLLIAAGQSNMKRLVLECGGKAPNLVFDDGPELDAIAEAVINSGFWNQGQVCVASSRLLVQESIKDAFLEVLIDKARSLSLGDPLKEATRQGALVSSDHKLKVMNYIVTGQKEGAHIIYQSSSSVPFSEGFYVAPTIFDNVRADHVIAQEEIFGPVLSVMAFQDEADAIRIANSTKYGLSATVWTKDMARAHRVAMGVQVGSIVVNATGHPRGGPAETILSVGGHKESGVGVEGGVAGLEAYLSKTAVQYFV